MNSFKDLKRYVSEQLENTQQFCYTLNHDALVETFSFDFLRMIKDRYGFEWGDPIPEMEEDEFFDLLKEYEL